MSAPQLHLAAQQPIAHKVEVLQAFLGEEYFDERGLMYAMWKWNASELRPFREDDFEGVAAPPLEEFGWVAHQNYENSASNASLFLWSQALRFGVTQEDAALEYCRKAFGSIDTIFRMTEADGAHGYLCKPWGGKVSAQTSPDQYIFASNALWAYRVVCAKIADKATLARIDFLLPAMADWWKERNYNLTAFDVEMKGLETEAHFGFGFQALQQMAFLVTGSAKYSDEARRIGAVLGAAPTYQDKMRAHLLQYGSVCDERTWQDFQYDLTRKEFITLEFESRSAMWMAAAPYHLFMRHDLERAPFYKLTMARIYHYIQCGLRDDLLMPYWVQVDLDRGLVLPVHASATPQSRENPMFGWSLYAYLSEFCYGDHASRIPHVAVMAHLWAREFCPGALNLAKRMLRALDDTRLKWFVDSDGEQFEPSEYWLRDVLSSDAPAMTCLTYWFARAHGLDLDIA
jgi:hypothetical protein